MPIAAHPDRCDVQALPEVCLLDPRIPKLLEDACRLCPAIGDPRVTDAGALGHCSDTQCPQVPKSHTRPGACLDTTQDQGAFADIALELTTVPHLRLICPVGFWAAYMVTLQYSSSTRPLDLPPGTNTTANQESFSWSDGFDLHPFPFWSDMRSLGDQVDLHSNFLSAQMVLCDDVGKTGLFRGKYILRAGHDKPEYHCAARSSDHQLIARCRERMRQQWHAGMRGFAISRAFGAKVLGVPPPRIVHRRLEITGIECPTPEEQAAFAARRSAASGDEWGRRSDSAIAKYTGRAGGSSGRPGRGCEEPASEWRVDLRIYHKCVLVVILERLNLAPGALVFDWGTGCGHKLTWAAQLYDIQGVGIDIVEDNIRWAEEHSIGKYCHLDGRYVEWLPDDHFDAVLSYAALTHLQPDDQCRVVSELVGKVRIGGHLWFGWNTPNINHLDKLSEKEEFNKEEFWSRCFTSALYEQPRWASGEVAATWETITEAHLFPDDFYRHDTYLFWPPAYSLFVVRAPADFAHSYL